MTQQKHRILILGASGFLGNSIYKELSSYFKTFGTYHTPKTEFENNHHFFEYNFEEDDIVELFSALKPTIIISALRGTFPSQLLAHRHIYQYLKQQENSKIIFLSSANVFDAYSKYPSYETDTTLSNSIYGHFKIRVEQQLLKLPKRQVAIIRLPMVFGTQSPRVNEIKLLHQVNEPIELFPNLIMNVSTDNRVVQQLHYIINRSKNGVFHCGSNDLVHHDDFIKDLVRQLGLNQPKFKYVYTTNEERYLAVLPKYNKLPKHLLFESTSVFSDIIKTF